MNDECSTEPRICDVCGSKAEFAIGLMSCDEIASYLCKPCMEKRNAEIKKLQEENDASNRRECKEAGIDLVDDCGICGKKLDRSRFLRIFPNLCGTCGHQLMRRAEFELMGDFDTGDIIFKWNDKDISNFGIDGKKYKFQFSGGSSLLNVTVYELVLIKSCGALDNSEDKILLDTFCIGGHCQSFITRFTLGGDGVDVNGVNECSLQFIARPPIKGTVHVGGFVLVEQPSVDFTKTSHSMAG